MRAVVQRVTQASVTAVGFPASSIGRGLLVLVGVGLDDTERDADWLATKLSDLRIFSDDEGHMNLSVSESKGEVMVVSQFTLLADASKGRRPSFVAAARPDVAEPLVARVATQLRLRGLSVATGFFGQKMNVESINDGPVTIVLDSI